MFDEISALTKQPVEQIPGLELAYVGVNAGGAAETGAISDAYCGLFSPEKKMKTAPYTSAAR
jgi:TorA maturation chaperone TorD